MCLGFDVERGFHYPLQSSRYISILPRQESLGSKVSIEPWSTVECTIFFRLEDAPFQAIRHTAREAPCLLCEAREAGVESLLWHTKVLRRRVQVVQAC